MAERRVFWGNLTPSGVRNASLWAVAGMILAFGIVPLLPADWRLLAALLGIAGKSVAIWKLTHINVGAPGWRIGTPGEFDERETAERHRALATAYVIVVLSVMGVLICVAVARLLGIAVSLPRLALIDVTIPAVCLLPALPGVILAWRDRRTEDVGEMDT